MVAISIFWSKMGAFIKISSQKHFYLVLTLSVKLKEITNLSLETFQFPLNILHKIFFSPVFRHLVKHILLAPFNTSLKYLNNYLNLSGGS